MVGVVAVLLFEMRERVSPDDTATGSAELSLQPGPTANTAAPNAAAATDMPLWETIDESAVGRLPEYAAQWSTAGRVLVRVSPAVAAADGWRVGDRLTLPLPQMDTVYRPRIEMIDDGPGLSRSASGKVTGKDGQRRRFLVTVGPAHVFAYIDTALGSYELVGGAELGWLIPTSSIMAGFDYGEPDYFLADGLEKPATVSPAQP